MSVNLALGLAGVTLCIDNRRKERSSEAEPAREAKAAASNLYNVALSIA
jgi:hypothetical protein